MQSIVDVYRTIEKSVLQCSAPCISLSGGLDSAIIAYIIRDRRPSGIAVIAKDFVATDLTYCQLVAKKLGISLQIKMADIDEIYQAIEGTIKILANFNEIEIRNNAVMYLAMAEAKKQGFSSIITGDGADELFAGYGFLVNKGADELRAELDRIRSIMHFPSQKIGKSLGVKVESPFCSEEVMQMTEKLPPELLVNERGGVRFGKWALRKAFEDKLPESIVWRQKSPMQEGAGTQALTEFFDRLIPDSMFSERRKEIKEANGVNIRSKESLKYYEIFRKYHMMPRSAGSERKCPDCGFAIGEGSRFCRMCGRFPI